LPIAIGDSVVRGIDQVDPEFSLRKAAKERMLDDQIVATWREAASHLGVRVVAPHSLELTDGTVLVVEAFLPDFGGPQGAVAVALDDQERCERATRSACFVSQLASRYRRFDVELFQDTLNDWQWFGPTADRPSWYTGKPWS
jgi:hypothetical protein